MGKKGLGLAAILFILGALLVLEGLFIGIDWAAFGIPSIIIGGFHFHHWELGLAIVLFIGGFKVLL